MAGVRAKRKNKAELIQIKHSEQCLAHSKCLLNVGS